MNRLRIVKYFKMETKKTDEYYKFLENLSKQIEKEKTEQKIIEPGVVVDCNELPCGSAIIWKMKNISLNDWDRIPLKEIAIAIKEGVNMREFANDYNIKLK